MIHRRTSLTVGTVICALVLGLGFLAATSATGATSSKYASDWSSPDPVLWFPLPPSSNILGPPEDPPGVSMCVSGSSSPGGAIAYFTFPAFSIPGGDLIQGVEVKLKYETDGDHLMKLTEGGTETGTQHSVPINMGPSTCDGTSFMTIGNPTDTWGVGLTAAKFNAGNIGVWLKEKVITLSSGDPGSIPIDMDAIQLVVHHGPANSPPTANAGGPYNVGEGGTVGLSAAGSSDPDQSTASLTFEWDLDNDGTFDDAVGISPIFSAAGKDGPTSQTIKVRVTDNGSLMDEATSSVAIANVAPSITNVTLSAASIDEGQGVTVTGSFTDPALGVPSETFSGMAIWSDGQVTPLTVGAGTFSTSRNFPDDHPATGTASDAFTVQVTISDDDGGSDMAVSSVLTVNNVAPTIDSINLSSSSIDEGQSVTVSGTFSDPALGVSSETFSGTALWSDGASSPLTVDGSAGTFETTRMFNDDDPTATPSDTFTVDVTIEDDDTGSDTDTSGVLTVNNVEPVVDAPTVAPAASDEGSAVIASATFSDVGVDDTHSCTVNYGDGDGDETGTVTGNTCEGPAHIYADNGDYTVTVEVTDDDTGAGSASTSHPVANVDPTITGSTNSAEECGDTPEGGLVEVSADFSDPGFDKPTAGTMEDFDASEIDWGDSTVEPATVFEIPGGENVATTGTVSGSHIYASGGIFTITVTVTDDDGGSDSIQLIALVTGAGLNGGEVQVVGTDFKDVVNIKKKGNSIEVKAGFIGTGKVAFPLVDVDSLRVLVCDGDDQVHVNHKLTMPAILEGDAGRDHLRAGNGSTLIEGGGDDDHLWGGDAADFIYGDQGNDFLYGGRGNDMLFGGGGDDTLFGQHDDDALDGGAGVDSCKGGPGTDTDVNCEAGDAAVALGAPPSG